ncbi:STAS domain-containing protein [Nocardia colli]|uniref:STAS domain-containing protein n=1 Tax=Nocardia colli TaxID=2545717 RepID=UPI0035DF862C
MPLEIRLDCYTDAVVLTGRGDIGVTCTKRLVAALRRAVEIPKPLVVVDFSRVEHCGSVGLAALVLATRTAAPRPVRVVPSTYIRRALRAGGLDRVLVLCPDLATACAT